MPTRISYGYLAFCEMDFILQGANFMLKYKTTAILSEKSKRREGTDFRCTGPECPGHVPFLYIGMQTGDFVPPVCLICQILSLRGTCKWHNHVPAGPPANLLRHPGPRAAVPPAGGLPPPAAPPGPRPPRQRTKSPAVPAAGRSEPV